MKYRFCIKGRYCNPALLKNRNQQAQAQASVGILGRGKINMWRNLNKPQALKICLNHKRPTNQQARG